MDLDFQDDSLEELQELFNGLDTQEAIFMSHYELAEVTGVTANRWKEFLTHPAVSMWVSQELDLFKEYQLKQMIRNATDNDKSVGAAQMINSLTKTLNEGQNKQGPIIVYTYVPLTTEQREGSPVETIELDQDILAMIPDNWRDDISET